MPRRATISNNFTKGVLDPQLSDRIDLEHYWNSLAEGQNLEAKPQGGFARRPGWALLSDPTILAAGYKRRLRRRIEPVSVTSGMITAHNGGTTGNLVDQDSTTLFTTSALAGSTFVVAEVDLGVSMPIVFLDVIGFKCATLAADDALAVEWWNGSAWVEVAGAASAALGTRRNIRTTARTRRFGEWPGGPGGTPVSARSWRLVVKNASGLGAISVAGIRFWKEKRRISPVREINFARSSKIVFDLVLTDRNIDVFQEQRYICSIPVPIAAHQIEEMNFIQSLDTLLMFHEDIPTIRITRQGASDEWDVDRAPYTNVPSLTAGTAFSGDQNEIQDVGLPGIVNGQSFVLWLGDAVTAPIAFTNAAGLPASVETAIEALPGINSAGVVVTVSDASVPSFQVEFAGANGARAWPALAAVVLAVDTIEPVHEIVQEGLDADGVLFGDVNGWPRCGTFVQARLMIGGFRAAPTTWGVTVAGGSSLYDCLNTSSPLTADKAFFRALDTDQVETIQQLFVGRHVQIFTDSSEWYGETRTFDATQPVNMIRATSEGIKSSVRVLFSDGASVFVQQGGRVIRDFLFSDIETSYKAEPLSLLAPHLLTDVIDVAHRKSRKTDEGNTIFMVNRDGSMAVLVMLRSQEVVAMAPHYTEGSFRSVASQINHQVSAIVERDTVDGFGDLYLEKRSEDTIFDGATFYSGSPRTICNRLEHLEGKTVWAYADNELVGPLTVASAQITLPFEASDIVVGHAPTFSFRMPTPREKLQNGYPFRPPGRIYECELSLQDTGSIEISTNNSAFRDVGLTHLGETRRDAGWLAAGGRIDKPMLERLFTGHATVENLRGWLSHPTMEFRQTLPTPVHIKAVRYEMAHGGG